MRGLYVYGIKADNQSEIMMETQESQEEVYILTVNPAPLRGVIHLL